MNSNQLTRDETALQDTSFLSQERRFLLKFRADECLPCEMNHNSWHKCQEKYGDQIEFVEIDVNREPELAKRFHIYALPTFVVIREGQIVDRMVGSASERDFEAFVVRG